MSESSAKVDSIDAIKAFKVALIKFAEAGMVALSAAEAEVNRTLMWLQLEQPAFWNSQLRKRQEDLARANEAYRAKAMFKDASGRTPDTTQELKAVQLCKKRIEEAEWKLLAIKKHKTRVEKELQNYKGGVQRFSAAVHSDLPRAAERLERVFAQLDSYVSMAAPEVGTPAGGLGGGSGSDSGLREDQTSMARPAEESAEKPKPAPPEAAGDQPEESAS